MANEELRFLIREYVKELRLQEAFNDSKARASARGDSLGMAMLKPDRHRYLSGEGHHQSVIDEMEELFNLWGQNESQQSYARNRILDAVDNNTPLGQAIRHHAEMETTLFEDHIDAAEERVEKRFKQFMHEFEMDGYIYIDGMNYTKNDLQDGTLTLDMIRYDAEKSVGLRYVGILYRHGKTGGRLESWTTNPEGAVRNNLTGQTFSGRKNEAHWSELKKQGYSVLAGPTRMMGAPGESEITLIRLDG